MIPAFDELHAWAGAALGSAHTTAELVKQRSWGMVLRVHSAGATYYAKANCDGLACEAGIYEVLSDLAPSHIVDVIATDTSRGWILLADGGPVLGEQGSVTVWKDALTEYAELQRMMSPHVDRLRAVGVPDFAPATLLGRWDELLDHPGLGRDVAEGTTDEELEQLHALTPRIREWSRVLIESSVPVTLQHDDVHTGNVFSAGNRIFDWGDAVIGFPFASLLNALRNLAGYQASETADVVRLLRTPTPEVAELVDSYLSTWADHGSLPDLRELAAVSVLLAPIGRALNWARIPGNGVRLESINVTEPAMAAWLRQLLAAAA